MTTRLSIILCSTILVYGLTVLLTDFSLLGFWTDIFFSISLFIFSIVVTFSHKAKKQWLTITLRTISICFFFVVYSFLTPFMTMFFADTFKLRSFCLIKVDGRLFNAYFKPVGAYSGGYGNFLITECPKYFPLIEHQVYYDRTVHHDFSEDISEGELIDNREIIRQIVKEHVIKKY